METEVENGETDSANETVFALHDFKGIGDKQLTFSKGDRILVHQKTNDEWWWAELNGCYGFVPVNHLSYSSFQQIYWQDEEYFGQYGNLKIHHEMLNDRARTEAYESAVLSNKDLLKDKIVLDVGCGTGVLSMMCAKHGQAKKVYAIEASNIADHTQKVVKHNKLDHIITVIKDYGENVVLQEKVDLIISEWMGTMLLFEMMIETVIIMRDKLLKEDGVLWPSNASLFMVPCSAHREYEKKVSFWDTQFGFDFSPLRSVAIDELLSKPVHNHVISASECLSGAMSVLDIELKTVTVEDLEENNSSFSFVISHDDVMHGFCMWFQVEFSPLAKDARNVFLNTGPFHKLTHWKHNLFLLDDPISVRRGDIVEGSIKITRNPDWRRHLRVFLKLIVRLVDDNSEVTEKEKMFYVWR